MLIILSVYLVETRESPEFHDLVRMDKAHWPRCLLWHGWLPMLSGVNGCSPWAADAFESAGYLVEAARGRYSSRLLAEWGPPDGFGVVEAASRMSGLKCVSKDPGLLLNAARFTTGDVRLVGQEPAPSKCVLLSTSRVVRKDMKDWVLSQEGDKWTVRFDVRDLGGHLDTFRGWSSTLAARVRLVLSRLILKFCSPSGFSW